MYHSVLGFICFMTFLCYFHEKSLHPGKCACVFVRGSLRVKLGFDIFAEMFLIVKVRRHDALQRGNWKTRKTDTNKQTEMKEVERLTNDEEICTHEIKEERKKS